MGALLPFTTTLLRLRGDRLISQGNQHCRGTKGASLRISCRNPASTGVKYAAAVRNRESSAKRGLSSQGSEDTHHSRPRALRTAATKTEECEWEVYCDILPDSCDCQTRLHLKSSSQTCETEEEASELMRHGSKKQLRLSFVSWDLLD